MRNASFWSPCVLREPNSSKVERGMALWSLGSSSFLYRSPQAIIYID
jgi:hypothetical protein